MQKNCPQCHETIDDAAVVCSHCGHVIDDNDTDSNLLPYTFFFGIFLLASLLSGFGRFVRGLKPMLLLDGLLMAITAAYVLFLRKELSPLLRWKSFSLRKTIRYTGIAILASIFVNLLIHWLSRRIFHSENYYFSAFSQLQYPKIVTLLVIALQPAFVEEFAFRGVLQHGLEKMFDARQALLITAFLFAMLHMSVITFCWLLPLALWIGYLRNKEQTIWYGVLIHFVFNATACIMEFFQLHAF